MIDRFLTLAAEPAAESDLRHAVAEAVQSLQASAGRGDPGQVDRAEAAVQADPQRAFTFDAAGFATLTADGQTWQAGRFETPSLAELRQRAPASKPAAATARLWVLDGASPVTDIGALQATAVDTALFQVASQFNVLEAPRPKVFPVTSYFHDPTQGPRASISAFPATLLRHYAAPGPGGAQLRPGDGQASGRSSRRRVRAGPSPVCNGYLAGHGGMGAEALVAALGAGFDRIRVGVHEAAPVVLGYNWDGAVEGAGTRRIGQVFTSTVAGGGYGGERLGGQFEAACRHLLRAAYLGPLLAAVTLRRTPAVLTLIGGGVFGNPIGVIWESILWAFDEVQPLLTHPLDVVVNGYNLSSLIDVERILPAVRERGGGVLRFDRAGLVGIIR